MRFPRISRLRWDKPPSEADTLETLAALLAATALSRPRFCVAARAPAPYLRAVRPPRRSSFRPRDFRTRRCPDHPPDPGGRLFMEQMDSTVIATSLPAIAADIGTSPIALKLAVTSYLVALAIFIPISGWMSDRFGAKNIFRLAIVVFVIGSIACGFANSIHAFVLSRFLQGIGGSMMTPVGRLLLVRGTPREELVSAMAWLTIPALIGPIMGPPLGGFLTTYLSWHWVFWINVPIGVLGLALVTRFLPAGGPRMPRPVDFPGFLLSSDRLQRLRLRPVGGQPAGAADRLRLRHDRDRRRLRRRSTSGTPAARAYPLLDPKMLRYPLFRAGIIGGSNFRIGIGAIPFLLPLMLQLGFGLNPFQSGLDHLRHRGRRPLLEVHRAVGVPQLRLPQRADHRRLRLGAASSPRQLPLHPDDAEARDHGLPAPRRRAALDLLHRGQRHGLLRHRRARPEPGHRDQLGGPAESRSPPAWRSPAACSTSPASSTAAASSSATSTSPSWWSPWSSGALDLHLPAAARRRRRRRLRASPPRRARQSLSDAACSPAPRGEASMSEEFDAIVIGAGQAGPSLAVRLAAAGQRVAIVERRHFGGTCINDGCRPTKTLVASARVAHLARRAADFGVTLPARSGSTSPRSGRGCSASSRRAGAGSRTGCGRTAGLTVIDGHARFRGPREIAVDDRVLAAERIFINVGARAAVPDLPGVGGVPTLTNTSLLALETLPRHLVVVGGGYIGLEFAQIFRRFGAAVTVVEKGPRLIAREDRGRLRGGARHPRGRGRHRADLGRMHPLRAAPGRDRRRRRLPRRRARGGRQPRPPRHGPAAPTPTTSGSTPPASPPTSAASSPSTTRSPPASPASGRSASATAAAPSPTPPTTTSRSSPRTSSTAAAAGSATACRPTRSSPTRRSAAPA